MNPLDRAALQTYINENIDTFHNARLRRLSTINLRHILKKKNKKLRDNFQRAVVVQKQARSKLHLQPVLGCCYGNAKDADNGFYVRKVGQSFWHFISGEEDLYLELIEPIGYQATRHNEAFMAGRSALQAQLVDEFSSDFCHPDGTIDWERLVQFNSRNRK